MKRLVSTICILLTVSVVMADAPRVAVLWSNFGEGRHRNDYDGILASLGWTCEKVQNTEFGSFVPRLGEFDILLGGALFNYGDPVDLGQYKDAFLGFMERGGAIALTDCNYPSHVDWLAALGDDWAVSATNCSKNGVPMKTIDTTHALFNAAAPVSAVNGTWSHMTPAAGWQVLSTCIDDGASNLYRRYGKGFMTVSSNWPLDSVRLRNIEATRQLHLQGVEVIFPSFNGLLKGSNSLKTMLTNITTEPLHINVALALKAPKYGTNTSSAQILQPGETKTFTNRFSLLQRCAYLFDYKIESRDTVLYQSEQKHEIPALLEVKLTEPAYRGAIYLAAPPPQISGHAVINALGDKVDQLEFWARLVDGETILAETGPTKITSQEFDFSFPLNIIPTSTLTLETGLYDPDHDQHADISSKKIPVIAVQENQVFIDADCNTRVDGKPFFPIAIYHLDKSEYPLMRELNFNTIQAWGASMDQTRENLDAAQATGLKVILESIGAFLGNRPFEDMQPWLSEFSNHPALLVWYITDEPSGDERFQWCKSAFEYATANEPQHPTYLVSCSPGEFKRFFAVTDILGIDPYPIPSPVAMVSDWMKIAVEAVNWEKPVWMIPQLHNWSAYSGKPEQGRAPTPEEERNMVYQGLVWGAKAIFYYPWDDGCTGMKYDPLLTAAVKQINAELALIGPELLVRKLTVTAKNDEQNPKLYAATYTGKDTSYVIAVSVADNTQEFSVPVADLADGDLEVMFEGRDAKISGGVITDSFKPLEVHVYRTR